MNLLRSHYHFHEQVLKSNSHELREERADMRYLKLSKFFFSSSSDHAGEPRLVSVEADRNFERLDDAQRLPD